MTEHQRDPDAALPVATAHDRWLALVIGGLYVMLLLGTLDDLGYARDEGFYFTASRRYQAWFELLFQDAGAAMARVDEYWKANSEHPALMKSLFALSHALLWDEHRVFAMEGTSFRFPAIVLSGVGVGVVYLWGAMAHGRVAGMVAALSLAAMPRFFFHSHLACFDAPVVTMWLLCAFAYWRAVAWPPSRRGSGWSLVAVGIAFGLVLNTKHNAWFLPFVVGAHVAWLAVFPRDGQRRQAKRGGLALVMMATVGPLLFYATWPWIWSDTVARLRDYATFHLQHVYYNMEFLGSNYFEPPMPRSYAFLMTAATVPMVTLLLFAVGVVVSLAPWRDAAGRRSHRASTTCLWLLAIGVQYAAWLRPGTPIFGGTKHWMTAYPFLALFAGVGAQWAIDRVRPWFAEAGSARWRAGFVALLVLPAVVQAGRAHPWGLSAYTPLVGGAPGAATLGLNRGFWGYTTGAVAGYLNDNAPPRARIYIHDTAWPAWEMLLADGRLRPDLVAVGQVGDADMALYHHEKHMLGVAYQTWVAFDRTSPDHVAGLDGVPVIWIYRRKR